MASHPMTGTNLGEIRLYLFAFLCSSWTTRMEPAAGRQLDRAGRLSFDTVLPGTVGRIQHRSGFEQNLCVWVIRTFIELFCGSQLNNFAKIHNRHTMGNQPDNPQVMGNKEHRTGIRCKCRFHRFLCRQVHMICRFIQHQKVWTAFKNFS